jgi:hypothetical protein
LTQYNSAEFTCSLYNYYRQNRALDNFTSYSYQMFDLSVKHIQETRLGSIRHETFMILCGNLPLLLPNVTCKWQTVRGTRPIIPVTRPIVPGSWPVVSYTRPVVACTKQVFTGTDHEFTRFINLVQLNWIHRCSTNYYRQNKALNKFTSQWHKGHRQVVLHSDTIIR